MRRIKAKGNKPTRTENAINALQCFQAELSNVRQTPIADMYYREYENQLIPAEGSTDVIMGEVLPLSYEYTTEDDYNACDAVSTDVIRDTLQQDPDTVAVDASMNRTRLLHDAGALEVGLDLATTIGAKNSMEKLLSHQMAVCHMKAMEIMGKPDHDYPKGREDLQVKMMNIAVRLMDSYQSGMITLSKVRNAGKQQTITVKQIRVEGGQNVFADNVNHGGRVK